MSYRKQRKKIHGHLNQNVNQNQCVEQPNRMLANGPNHPGPGPEEIPMVDVSHYSPVHTQVVQLMYNTFDTTVVVELIFLLYYREFVCTRFSTQPLFLENRCVNIFVQTNLPLDHNCFVKYIVHQLYKLSVYRAYHLPQAQKQMCFVCNGCYNTSLFPYCPCPCSSHNAYLSLPFTVHLKELSYHRV